MPKYCASAPRRPSASPAATNGDSHRRTCNAIVRVLDSLFLRGTSTTTPLIHMWQGLERRLGVSIAAVSGLMAVVTPAPVIVMGRLTCISRRIG